MKLFKKLTRRAMSRRQSVPEFTPLPEKPERRERSTYDDYLAHRQRLRGYGND